MLQQDLAPQQAPWTAGSTTCLKQGSQRGNHEASQALHKRQKAISPGIRDNRLISTLTRRMQISNIRRLSGAIAQLGERYNGIVEVGGSRPPSSTKVSPSSRGLGHRPFTAATPVRTR